MVCCHSYEQLRSIHLILILSFIHPPTCPPAPGRYEEDAAALRALPARRARWTNMTVRKDGVETTYEADWIKHMHPVGFDWPKSAIPAAKG